MADVYANVQKSSLKLKGIGELSSGKKKKKKSKESKKHLEQILTTQTKEDEAKRVYLDKRTPAQVAFDKTQEKRPTHADAATHLNYYRSQQMERILNKASKTHKQRVEDFNRHLDTLTEHYDIPKVSWTK